MRSFFCLVLGVLVAAVSLRSQNVNPNYPVEIQAQKQDRDWALNGMEQFIGGRRAKEEPIQQELVSLPAARTSVGYRSLKGCSEGSAVYCAIWR
jgi:hypothetical protein